MKEDNFSQSANFLLCLWKKAKKEIEENSESKDISTRPLSHKDSG